MCIKAFRIIRQVEDNPIKEYIKNFLRLVGCLVVDIPYRNQEELIAILRNTPSIEDSSVDIILKRNQTLESGNIIVDRGNNIVQLSYKELPETGKAEWRNELLSKLVKGIWNDGRYYEQMMAVQKVYQEKNLFGYLVIKQGFIVRNVSEVFGSMFNTDGTQYKFVEQHEPFVQNMINAFEDAGKSLKSCLFAEGEGIPYVEYAHINLVRKIIEIRVAMGDRDSGSVMNESLLEQLHTLYEKDPEYLGTKFLAAIICSKAVNAPSMAEYYFQSLLASVDGREDLIHSFAFYEYGRYLEKRYENLTSWESAIPYYQAAAQLNPLCYQAVFKIGSYYMIHGQTKMAIEYFEKTMAILMEGVCQGHMEYLSLKGIQYVFKTAYILNRLGESQYFYWMEPALEYYHDADSIFVVYDSEEEKEYLDKMKEYHQNHDLKWALS